MDFDETELILMLEEIRKIIIDHDFNQVIWTGDINADFKRTTTFVGIIDKFIFDMGICKSWDKHHVDFTHASELNGVTYTSTIDHFFWNKSCNDYITDAGALHLAENMSDHSPIFCKLNISCNQSSVSSDTTISFPSWKKATDSEKSEYFNQLERDLVKINIPTCVTNCNDVHCKNELHKSAIDDVMLEVLQTVENSANTYIPQKTTQVPVTSKSKIPYWKVEPIKDNAHFWHSIWVSAGKPIN